MRISPANLVPIVAVPMLVMLSLAGCTPTGAPAPSPGGSSAPPAASDSASPSPSAAGGGHVGDPTAPDGQCPDSSIAVSVEGADSTAGHLHYRVVFTNTGTSDCVLQGIPTVFVVGNGNSTEYGVVAAPDTGASAPEVTLAAGGTGVAQLQAVNIDPAGGPLGTSCAVNHGDGYIVLVPHLDHQFVVAAAGVAACTNGTPWMDIGPILAG
jgi:Protein of unknown function (DUF4232)